MKGDKALVEFPWETSPYKKLLWRPQRECNVLWYKVIRWNTNIQISEVKRFLCLFTLISSPLFLSSNFNFQHNLSDQANWETYSPYVNFSPCVFLMIGTLALVHLSFTLFFLFVYWCLSYTSCVLWCTLA